MQVSVAPAFSLQPASEGTSHVAMSSVTLILLALLCLSTLPEAKRPSGQPKPDKPRQPPPSTAPSTRRARNRSLLGSGELSTKDGHRCVWQTSGEGLVSLTVNCTVESKSELPSSYWCRYAGKPALCPAYGLKSSQYWKQLVGKLKKRQNACDGEKLLKAKTCKKAPAEAHMKLAQHSATDEKRAASRKKGGGDKAERRKKKEELRTGARQEEEEDLKTGVPQDEEKEMLSDMAPAQSFCSEGWSSVCGFFVRFFEG